MENNINTQFSNESLILKLNLSFFLLYSENCVFFSRKKNKRFKLVKTHVKCISNEIKCVADAF